MKQEYGCDFTRIALKSADSWELKIENDRFTDEFGIVRQKASIYYDIVEYPLADADRSDLENFNWPDPHDPGRTRGLKEEAKKLYQETDYVIIADMISGGIFEQALRMRGYRQFFLDLVENQDFAHALLDKLLEVYLGLYENYIEAVGDYTHIFALADDLGMQNGLIVSPAHYREFIKPRQHQLYKFIKERAEDSYIFHHSCGSIFPLIGDLIEVGVDILQSVQTSASNMDIRKIKQEFGQDLTFYGAIDVQHMLPERSADEVAEVVKETINILGQDGGYVLSASHNIQPDVPPENIDAIFKTSLEMHKNQ